MTPARYRACLDELGLSQARLAEMLEVTDRQSRRWACGETSIPRAIEIVLESAIDARYLARLVREMKKAPPALRASGA